MSLVLGLVRFTADNVEYVCRREYTQRNEKNATIKAKWSDGRYYKAVILEIGGTSTKYPNPEYTKSTYVYVHRKRSH